MRAISMMIAGAIMLISSAAHGILGWKAMHDELSGTGAGPDLVNSLGIGWLWGSASMLGFGILTTIAGVRLRRGEAGMLPAVMVVGACYLVFGAAAFIYDNFNPHFMLFIAPGLMAGLPAMAGRQGD